MEGAEEGGSAVVSCLTAFFAPFSFLMGTFRRGIGVSGSSEEGGGGGSGCQQSHNGTSFFIPTGFSS